MKKYINRRLTFCIYNTQVLVNGVLIDYSREWTLLAYNPVDFVLDGFLLIRNSSISGYNVSPLKSIESKILIRKIKQINKPITNIESNQSVVQSLFEQRSVFAINNYKEQTFLVGRISEVNTEGIRLSILTPKSVWKGEKQISINQIDSIELDSDYINSILLVAE